MRLEIDNLGRGGEIPVALGPGKRRPLKRTKTAVQTGY
nr:MAG TPA: hypothetical protein [Caudoviricetes sp.]DAZ46491.1 MAG TPA: hypothetical protein [Caudoviricetes sp.]